MPLTGEAKKAYQRAWYQKKKKEDPKWYAELTKKAREWQAKHPIAVKQHRRKSEKLKRKKKRKFIFDKLGWNCNRCSENEFRILEIHHKERWGGYPSKEKQATMQSWKWIKEHLKELEILCPNCHAKEHLKHSRKGNYLAKEKEN